MNTFINILTVILIAIILSKIFDTAFRYLLQCEKKNELNDVCVKSIQRHNLKKTRQKKYNEVITIK